MKLWIILGLHLEDTKRKSVHSLIIIGYYFFSTNILNLN